MYRRVLSSIIAALLILQMVYLPVQAVDEGYDEIVLEPVTTIDDENIEKSQASFEIAEENSYETVNFLENQSVSSNDYSDDNAESKQDLADISDNTDNQGDAKKEEKSEKEIESTAVSEMQTQKYIVVYEKPKNSLKTKKMSISRMAAKERETITFSTQEMTQEEAEELADADGIAYVELDGAVAILDETNESSENQERIEETEQQITWGMLSIGADKSIAEYGGSAVKVAVLDTGVSSHEDLQLAGGVSLADYTEDYSDDNGHGTHIAGIIAASNNNIGIVGVAPEVELYSVKILDRSGRGTYGNVIAGINWAIENNMNVINLSLGGREYSRALEDAVNSAVDAGIIVVAAAGNNGADGEMTYPARYENVVSVGAVNSNYRVADFSSTGLELDILAPGTAILSLSSDGESYSEMSGTSMAAAFVSGAFAALIEQNHDVAAAELPARIYETATRIDNNATGNRMLNLAGALGLTDQPIAEIPQDIGENETDTENGTFSIINSEMRLAEYKAKLESYAEQARENGENDVAKEITAALEALTDKDAELHDMPKAEFEKVEDEQETETKSARYAAEINAYYAQKADQFAALDSDFAEVIESFSERFADDEITVADDGALPDITEEETDSQGLVNSTATFYSIGLNSPINVSSSTARVYRFRPTETGSYIIKTSPYGNTSKSNDTYLELYTSSSCSSSSRIAYNDDYNGSFAQITANLSSGKYYYIKLRHYNNQSSIYAKIQVYAAVSEITLNKNVDINLTKGDYVVYKFKPTISGLYEFKTSEYGGSSNTTSDTFIELYSNSSLTNRLAYDDDGGTDGFSLLKHQLTSGTTYYVKVRPYSSRGALYARFRVSKSAINPITISLNSTANVTVEKNSYVLYKFTPSESGSYSIETGPYSGTYYDTYLELYSNSSLTNRLAYDDDGGTKNLSLIKYNMTSGVAYYIKLKGFSNKAVKATIKVTKNAPPIQNISLNSNIDVIVSSGSYSAYKFTPNTSGTYVIETSKYKGSGSNSDTYLELYSNSALTRLLKSDDDSGSNTFSKIEYSMSAGTSYYISFRGYNYNAAQARLKVTKKVVLLPNNTGMLQWPVESTEITLRFGGIDEQYTVQHTGIDIQGEDGSKVYSVSSGVVAKVQTGHAHYGNVVYVNCRYNGENIQIRYAHLKSGTINVSVGQTISKGTQIGEMGATGNVSINNSDRPVLLELEILRSTNGEVCETNGSNTLKVDPLDYFETITTDGVYLTKPFTTSLNTTGVSTQAKKDKAYTDNLDLNNNEAYLRRILFDCITEKHPSIASRITTGSNGVHEFPTSVLSYNSSSNTATIKLNGKTLTISNSSSNVRKVNDRFAVDYDYFIGYFYGMSELADYNVAIQKIIGGKYRDGTGGLKLIYANNDGARRSSETQTAYNERIAVRDRAASLASELRSFDVDGLSEWYLVNNEDGATVAFYSFGHTAVIIGNSKTGKGIFLGFYGEDGTMMDDGECRVGVVDMQKFLENGEVTNLMAWTSSDNAYIRNELDYYDSNNKKWKYDAYDRYITKSVTNENALRMLNTGAGLFASPSSYSVLQPIGNEISSEQCDKKAWKISRSGGINYNKKVRPNDTIQEAANSLGVPMKEIGD